MCAKRRYPNRRRVHDANRHNGKRIRAYFCQACKAWHATTQDRRDAR